MNEGVLAAAAKFAELHVFYEIHFCSAVLQDLLQTYNLINICTPLGSDLRWFFFSEQL